MKKIITMACIMGLAITSACYAQDSIRMTANPKFNKASKTKRFLFGEHYRKEWATFTNIEILDMNTEAGGLTPVKMGGGLQTKSLRLKGGNGKEYVLRSVNKDPSKAIVAELRGTFADDIVQDQISSANPFAPMVVAVLSEQAGIFHNRPKLVFVPVSDRLGEYGSYFGATLCLLEERPSGSEENNAAYDYAKKVINTQKLYEKTLGNSAHQVDEKAFLKARLFDMLIGDWDRHEDQWLWAAFEENGKTLYRPIPRDRDQAFSRMDGVIPQMATRKWGIRKIQDFDYDVRDIYGLNFAGIHLDRNFTTRLGWNDWLSITKELQAVLTDEVIDKACQVFPPEIYALSGNTIAAKLKQRRNDLQKYAWDYYRFVSKEVNIKGSNDKEIFEVSRVNEDYTTVVVYRSSGDNQKGEAIFYRTFVNNETSELRLYGLEGNDVFNITGSALKGIMVRVIGGNGKDSVVDNGTVRHSRHTRVYDEQHTSILAGRATRKSLSADSLKTGYNPRSFRFDWLAPVQSPGYNPDDGLYLGGGVIYKKQQFGKAPYGYMQSISGNYAFRTGAYTFSYQGIFKEAVGKWDFHTGIQVLAPNYSRNYYGSGNETEQLDKDKQYYRVRFNQVVLSSSLQRELGKHRITIGSDLQTIKVENNEGRFITSETSKLDSVDFNRKYYSSLQLGYQFSTVDHPLYPRKGVRIQSGAKYTQDLKSTDQRFVQVYAEASSYVSFGAFTLASRTGFATNIGDDYAFYQANTIGGLSNLRGYRRDRFAGKTSLYSNTELRVRFSEVNAYMVKGVWGLLAFADHGRVWMPEEESKKWHYGYGGGVWFMPFNKIALTATYGISKEDKLLTIGAGFLF